MKYESAPATHNKKGRTKALAVALTPLLFAVAACSPSKHNAAPTTTTAPKVEAPTTTSTPQEAPTTSALKPTETTQPEVNQYKVNSVVETMIQEKFADLPEKILAFHEGRNMSFQQYKTEGDLAVEGHDYISILSQSRDMVPGSSEVGYSLYVVYEDRPEGRDFEYIQLFTNSYDDPETMNDPELKGFRLLSELILAKNPNGDWIPAGTNGSTDGTTGLITDGYEIVANITEFAELLSQPA